MIPEDESDLDGGIYSPEGSDGRTDWPSTIAWAFLLVLLVALFFLGIWWVLAPTAAHAQQGQCGPMEESDANFLKQYNEAISGAGFAPLPIVAYEVLVSPHGRTFTILALDFQKKEACIIGSGFGWVQIPVPDYREPKEKL